MEPAAAARVWTVVASALVGLATGSFLNVVVYRVPRGMSVVRPPSHCPACGTELRAADNVPLVSWLVLRGRCRTCNAPIAVRYPLVELGTALAFLGLALAVGAHWALPPLLVVSASAIAASVIDLDGHAVPWPVVVVTAVGAASLVAVGAATASPGRIGWALLGSAASWLAMVALDRAPEREQRGLTVGLLGWCAGWLWAPAGPLLAAWVIGVVAAAGAGRRRSGARRPVPLAVVAVGAYGLLLAGAVVGLAG